MFRVTVLGSGSAGNCAVVQSEHCTLLLDGGLSARQITVRLESLGLAVEELDGILLTHEHQDHARGVEVLCRKVPVPIYGNALTANALRDRDAGCRKDWRIFATGREFSIKDIDIEVFSVPHDAMDPVGFTLRNAGRSLGLLTDLGLATRLVMERVRAVQTLILEANHDEKLLQEDTKRPWSIKQRIMSRHGHLSNQAAARVVRELVEGGLERVVLGHLSRDCNTPELAIGTVRQEVPDTALEVICSAQREVSACFEVSALSGQRKGPAHLELDLFSAPMAVR